MLYFRQVIIYILALAVLWAPVPAFSEPVQVPAAPPVITDPAALDAADNDIAAGEGEFEVSKADNEVIEESYEKTPPQKMTTSQLKDWFEDLGNGEGPMNGRLKVGLWKSFQSTVTVETLLAIQMLHAQAHQENMQLNTDSMNELNKKFGPDLPMWQKLFYSSLGAAVAAGSSYTIKQIFQEVAEPIRNKFMDSLFSYLIAGTVLSVGTNYIGGYVSFAAQEVLDHPQYYGGVSLEERAALTLIQKQKSIIYLGWKTTPLSAKVELSNEDRKNAVIMYNAAWKVAHAMKWIGLHWSLTSKLFSHLWRQAGLQGSNASAILANMVNDGISYFAIETGDPFWMQNRNAFIIGIGVGLAASLIPNWEQDYATSYFDQKAVAVQKTYSNWKLWKAIKEAHWTRDPETQKKRVADFLEDESESRQNRVVKFTYLMRLSIQRMDQLEKEQQQLVKNTGRDGKFHMKPADNWKDRLTNTYNYLMGTEFVSPSRKYSWDSDDIQFYRSLFYNAADRAIKVYSDEVITLQNLDSDNFPLDVRIQISLAQRDVAQLKVYFESLKEKLSQKWTLVTPLPRYFHARDSLDQFSYWGVSEKEALKDIDYRGGQLASISR